MPHVWITLRNGLTIKVRSERVAEGFERRRKCLYIMTSAVCLKVVRNTRALELIDVSAPRGRRLIGVVENIRPPINL